MDLNRVPPQSIDAEKSVIGGLLLDEEAWDQIADIVSEEVFYKPSHKKIFAAICELQKKNEPVDLVTVSNLLMAKNELDAIGGPGYLGTLLDQTPSATNIANYAKIIQDKYMLRRLIKINSQMTDKAYSHDFEDVNSFMDSCEAEIYALAEQKQTAGLVSSGELIKMSLKKLEELHAQKGQLTGIPTGFTDLDTMTAGFHPGELTIIAARPSMGKTAFSLNIALQAAVREKKSVAYFSVEMGKESVMMRMLANEARVKLSDLKIGALDNNSWPKVINTAAKMSDSHIFINDTSGISPFEIRSQARRLKSKHGLDMIMIDYLQLMSLKQRVESREREVSEISKTLKSIAKELGIPVIALAQLNRGVEGRADRRPMLSDLRESGSIEQDADVIMMLYREDYYDRENPDIKGQAEVIIGKQRNGPTGIVKLRWIPEFGIFANNIDQTRGPNPPPQGPPPNFNNNGGNNNAKNFAPNVKPIKKNFAPQ